MMITRNMYVNRKGIIKHTHTHTYTPVVPVSLRGRHGGLWSRGAQGKVNMGGFTPDIGL